MDFINHNHRLKECLTSVEASVTSAGNPDELASAIEPLTQFPTPVGYRTLPYFAFATILLIPPLINAYLFTQGKPVPIGNLIGSSVLLIIAIILFVYAATLTSALDELTKSVLNKKAKLDHQLVDQTNDGPLAKNLMDSFSEFTRGNYSRDFESVVLSLKFNYFHFHYVNRRTETHIVTDAKGNTRTVTRTVYDHYHRYGISLPFIFASDIWVMADIFTALDDDESTIQFKPASNNFNEQFELYARTELDAARFAKPAIVLLIEELANHFSGINIEIRPGSGICVSFDDDDLFMCPTDCGLENPVLFMQQLHNKHYPKLDQLLLFVKKLIRLTDDNFAPKDDL